MAASYTVLKKCLDAHNQAEFILTQSVSNLGLRGF